MSQERSNTQTAPELPDYKRMLVAYDGSKNSERALSRAMSLAEKHHASLGIVVVVSTMLPAFSPYSPSLPLSAYEEVLQGGKDTLARAVERAKQSLGDVSGFLQDGQAADEILNVANEQKIDLIVIGRRGLSAVERFLMGGVSSAVVNHSKCDVLVVK